LKRDKYDKVVSDLVRAINHHTCEKCGKTGRMEAAHIFGRRHAGTRYDLANLLCLCHSCHRKYTENPVDFTRWLEDYIGTEAIDNLRLKAWKVHKWKAGEKEAMYKKHKEMLAECIDNA
jgi:5-methylcytosine-specific restriction endonuclease McrA